MSTKGMSTVYLEGPEGRVPVEIVLLTCRKLAMKLTNNHRLQIIISITVCYFLDLLPTISASKA